MSLEERLLEFEKCYKNGIKVHWASSDEDACEIVYEIMKEKYHQAFKRQVYGK